MTDEFAPVTPHDVADSNPVFNANRLDFLAEEFKTKFDMFTSYVREMFRDVETRLERAESRIETLEKSK